MDIKKLKGLHKKEKLIKEEIERIDWSINRLVYDLYSLIEEETLIVEQSIWSKNFESIYTVLSYKNVT